MLKLNRFIDKNGKIFGKYDIFTPILIIMILLIAAFIFRILTEKSEYVTVQLYASGGEWWWDQPEPPYWLTDPVVKGSLELDPTGDKLVEVLEVQKFEAGDRKMLWMKARLKVAADKKSKQYRFRREPLQVGSLIYIAPNNVRIFCNVMFIDGVGEPGKISEKLVTVKAYNQFPWKAEALKIGEKMLDDNGNPMAEIVERNIIQPRDQVLAVNDKGIVVEQNNPERVDVTVKVKMQTLESNGINYFSFFQPIKIGFYLWVPFKTVNFDGYITKVE